MNIQEIRLSASKVKKFESRVLNRSCADLLFYDKIADYLLEWFSTQTRPNTLSLFSILPVLACNMIVLLMEQKKWWMYLLCSVGIFLHQIFDIANKKQAYRLMQFTLSTYYIDHLYDTLSCFFIINMTAKLILLSNQSILLCLYFFGLLPFFTHHLAMYSNGYFSFDRISPAVQGISNIIIKVFDQDNSIQVFDQSYQLLGNSLYKKLLIGLLIVEILLIFIGFYPQLLQMNLLGFRFQSIFIFLSFLWLLIFLIDDIRSIVKTNNNNGLYKDYGSEDKLPVKNMFVISIFGYVVLQSTSIQNILLTNQLYLFLFSSILFFLFTIVIGQILLAYGCSIKYKQITIPMLQIFFLIVIFYSFIGLLSIEQNLQMIVANIFITILFAIIVGYCLYYHYQNIKSINQTIKDQE